ncbi:MAG: cation-translocating P-type ATPase [Verrucomicrobiota bacterium]|jgi:Cu+-exporting ATPase
MTASIQAGPRSELLVTGMNCANCARHVTDALQGVSGVAGADVSLPDGRARVRWQPGVPPNLPALSAAVRAAGYDARPAPTPAQAPSAAPMEGWRLNVALGASATTPLMIGEWVFHWGMETWFHWLAFALALPVQVFCGARFYKGAWRQLKSGGSNMDTLVALGSTAAFGYSAWALLSGAGGHLYFMEAAAIITLISIGHWIEAVASRHAEKSLRALLQLAPQTARRRQADGTEAEVPIADLQPGDTVILRPGDAIPTDGTLIEGHCSVNEAMLTGESLPVEKEGGSRLYAGTSNLDGRAVMEVTAVGDSTAMAVIIAAVQRAQNSRADIQRLADRVSNVFVPLVVLIALATALWWGLAPGQAHRLSAALGRFLWLSNTPATPLAAAVLSAVAVLIVACPCAMGLATPVAIMAGTNAAARRGILIRDGIALEKAGNITVLLADKTGTLTCGKPTVVATQGGDLPLAASLAAGSKHPLSQAVAKLAAERIPLPGWREIRGSGLEAGAARLGSLIWLAQCGVDTSDRTGFVEKWSASGATILGLAEDRQLRALIALQDTLKPAAAEVVRQLGRDGLKVFLVTGDNPRTARAIASQAGIDASNVFAEIRPERKAEIVRQLQQRGERVAFVGDGINDAPALEQADLGIAVSQASDVASAAADIVLLKSSIQAIPEALDLARATLRTIRQNLFWAFFYNAAAVPLAALGFLSPILCAAAMGLSDLVVIGNAIRLGAAQPRRP